MCASVLREILLMIFFRAIERWRRFDLRDDRSPKASALFQFGVFRFSGRLLFRRVVENNRAVLRTDVGALAIARSRIMVAPENVQQLPIGNLRRVKDYFDYFGMARFIATNIFIGRIFRLSSRITDGGILHSIGLPEYGLDSPKTSGAKGRLFSAHGCTIKRETNRCNRLRLTRRRPCHCRHRRLLRPYLLQLLDPEQLARAVAGISPAE